MFGDHFKFCFSYKSLIINAVEWSYLTWVWWKLRSCPLD